MAGVAREAGATAALIALLSIVHHDGWLGPYPPELLLLLVVLSQMLRVRAINTTIFGDPGRRLWLRIGVHFACLLPALYLSGWGPVALVALLALTGLYITAQLLRSADQAMYEAKHHGRNCVKVAEQLQY